MGVPLGQRSPHSIKILDGMSSVDAHERGEVVVGMSRRHLVLGVSLVLLAAASVLCAGNAWAAAPEYGRCAKAEENAKKEFNGSFSNSSCTLEVKEAERAKKGKYTWLPGAVKKKFTSTGGAGILETVGGSRVECKTESSTGEFKESNKEEAGVVVTFTGCIALGAPCTSSGKNSGELVTNELEATVGWENKALKKTDVELFPAKSVTSGLFIEFNCQGLTVKVKGAVLVPIKNDKMTETETLKFKATKGKQKPEKWEESNSPEILESAFSNVGHGFEQAGQTITATIKAEEKLELNAVV
jgi:hypothetical protein